MKRIVLVVALFAITALLVGCAANNVKQPDLSSESPKSTECTHDYGGLEKCDPDRVCLLCGYKPTPYAHRMTAGDCQTRAVCRRCGAEGDYGSHDYSGGNCIEPAKCSICGETGELGDHDFVYEGCETEGVCSVCGETAPALGHDMRAATCTSPATCDRCGYEEGEALGHEGTGRCTRCNELIPITGSGYGDGVVTNIDVPDINGKFWVMHITHTGSGVFTVDAYDSDGEEEYLVTNYGAYDGVVLITSPFPITLNIKADGNWTYEVYALEETTATSFSGNSDTVTPISSLDAQVWRFTYSGDGVFVVWAWTKNGSDLVVSNYGQYDSEQVFIPPDGSKFFFEVTADADWSITPVE